MKKLTKYMVFAAFVLVTAEMFLSPRVEAQRPNNALAARRYGVTVNRRAAFQGYTLVAPMRSTSTYLIDMKGRIVNEWVSDYTPALSAYLLENGHLLRPGAGGRSRGGRPGPGAGGRIQEFTWGGELVWDYSFDVPKLGPHHDICRLPNGNTLVIACDPKTKDEAIAAGRRPDSVGSEQRPDCILEIKPTGKTTGEIVWRWHVWDHLVQDFDKSKPNYGHVAEHPDLIDVNYGTGMMDRVLQDPKQLARLRSLGYVGGGSPGSNQSQPQSATLRDGGPSQDQHDRGQDGPDRGRGAGPMQGNWTHVNFVAYNAKLDQIMISVHGFNEVWVIDHSTTTAEAASHEGGRSGKGGDLIYRWGNPRAYRSGSNVDQRLCAQHGAHWIEDSLPGAGNMLVFNNISIGTGGRGTGTGMYSSVDEIVLPLNDKGLYDKDENLAFGPTQAAWSYSAPNESTFFSRLVSSAQRLPNGNTFICSGNQALLFEVTSEGKIVWRYKHPRGRAGGPGGIPRPGVVLVPAFLQQVLAVTDSQKQLIRRLQSDVDAKLARLLTREQGQKLKQAAGFRPRGQGGLDRRRAGPQRDGSDRPRGAGPGGVRPSRVGEVIPQDLIDELALSEAQRTELRQIQQEVDDHLGEIWTEGQKTQLKETGDFSARGQRSGPSGLGSDDDRRRADRRDRGSPGGPGGIFCSYRYGTDFPGLAGRDLRPKRRLDEVAATTRPSDK